MLNEEHFFCICCTFVSIYAYKILIYVQDTNYWCLVLNFFGRSILIIIIITSMSLTINLRTHNRFSPVIVMRFHASLLCRKMAGNFSEVEKWNAHLSTIIPSKDPQRQIRLRAALLTIYRGQSFQSIKSKWVKVKERHHV